MGSSTKTTQIFHINKFEWYIETNCTSLDPSSSIAFVVTAFPGNKPIGNDFTGIVTQTVPGTETNYIHGSGDFYLQIIGMNVREWSVKVYQ